MLPILRYCLLRYWSSANQMRLPIIENLFLVSNYNFIICCINVFWIFAAPSQGNSLTQRVGPHMVNGVVLNVNPQVSLTRMDNSSTSLPSTSMNRIEQTHSESLSLSNDNTNSPAHNVSSYCLNNHILCSTVFILDCFNLSVLGARWKFLLKKFRWYVH